MSWKNILKSCERGAAQDLANTLEEILGMIESDESLVDYSSTLLDFSELLSAPDIGADNINQAFEFMREILQDMDRLGKVGPGFIGEMLDKLGRIREEYNQCKLT